MKRSWSSRQLLQVHRSEISAVVALHAKTLEDERPCAEERYGTTMTLSHTETNRRTHTTHTHTDRKAHTHESTHTHTHRDTHTDTHTERHTSKNTVFGDRMTFS